MSKYAKQFSAKMTGSQYSYTLYKYYFKYQFFNQNTKKSNEIYKDYLLTVVIKMPASHIKYLTTVFLPSFDILKLIVFISIVM